MQNHADYHGTGPREASAILQRGLANSCGCTAEVIYF